MFIILYETELMEFYRFQNYNDRSNNSNKYEYDKFGLQFLGPVHTLPQTARRTQSRMSELDCLVQT